MAKTIQYEDIQKILTQPMPERTRVLIAFQYASGCRIGELLRYTHRLKNGKTYETQGLTMDNVTITNSEINWTMPNFKTKKKDRKIKNPFILKEERLLWHICSKWLNKCHKQVFLLRESRARELIRNALPSMYSSHDLRASRATHLVDLFGFSAYDIMATLGHTDLKSGLFYVSVVERRNKLKKGLLAMSKVSNHKQEEVL